MTIALSIPIIILLISIVINLIKYLKFLKGKRSILVIIYNLIVSILTLVFWFYYYTLNHNLEANILLGYSIIGITYSILLIIDRIKYKGKKEEVIDEYNI
jgi:hypothetical protein